MNKPVVTLGEALVVAAAASDSHAATDGPGPDTEFARYTIAPWTNVPASKSGTCSDKPECCICGRIVREPVQHWAVVIDGGADWGDKNSDENDAGYMGWWPVGPDCHKRYVVKAPATPAEKV